MQMVHSMVETEWVERMSTRKHREKRKVVEDGIGNESNMVAESVEWVAHQSK